MTYRETQLAEDRAQLEAIREKAARWADVRFLLDLIDLAATPDRWGEFLAVIGEDDGR